jgi:hypothetical protein
MPRLVLLLLKRIGLEWISQLRCSGAAGDTFSGAYNPRTIKRHPAKWHRVKAR